MKKDVDVVIAELERTLIGLSSNYQQAVSNLTRLRECVDKDDLTKLLRRGAFMRKLEALLNFSKEHRPEQAVSLMMIDVDHFKRVNDSYGHQTGDLVLERVSQLLLNYLGIHEPSATSPDVAANIAANIAGRYGGEEIIVAFQGSLAKALELAETFRRAVESTTIQTENNAFSITLSIGIASTIDFGFDGLNLISKADEALYSAKKTGRNKTVVQSKLQESAYAQTELRNTLKAA